MLGWVGYVVLLALILTLASLYGWAKHFAPSLTDAAIKQAVAPPPVRSVFKSDAMTVLLLGCDDSFTSSGQLIDGPTRSDMMMVVRMDFAKSTVSGLSIPRDTVMKLSGAREESHRINAFHSFGGPELSRQAVEWLTKVKIDRVARLDSWQFMEMINSLGGVTVESPKALEYTDRSDGLYIRIKKGRNELNGYEALGFVRFRHDDDDLARGQRQRAFLMAMRERMKANPTAALQAVDRLAPLLGRAFTQDELLSLIRMGVGMPASKIKMASWPVKPVAGTGTLTTDRTKVPLLLDLLGMKPTLGDAKDPMPDKGGPDSLGGPATQPLASKIEVTLERDGHEGKQEGVKKIGP